MSMTVTTDNLAKVLATMAQLVKKDVLVGIPDSAPEREEDTPLSNAQIGYILDNGSPKANIPARPFLVPGWRTSSRRSSTSFAAVPRRRWTATRRAWNAHWRARPAGAELSPGEDPGRPV